uniref:Uncharacterized protein n=1 Tax=Plectus sambesii TaxID=2011161 RepID=A0A914VV04_9BILA
WYSWDYDSEASLSWLVQGVEEWIEVSVIIVSGIIYIIVVIFLIITRKKFQEISNYAQEKRILIQAAVITIYCTILNVTWHNYSLFLPDSKWAYMGLNFMWIYNSGINPVIYLILNKTVQDKVKVLSKKSTAAVSTKMKRLKEQTRLAWTNTNPTSGDL